MDKQSLHQSIINSVRLVFSRSGGKGGQNVNKVNTKVQTFIKIDQLQGLSETELNLLRLKLKTSINAENEIFVSVQEERTQERNREIAINRLENNISNAIKINKPRKKTKPSKSSIENRLQIKKLHSAIKKSRQDKSYRDL